MIPVDFLKVKEEVSYKIVELKQWIADKQVVSYQAWLDSEEGNPRTAMEKVISSLKMADDSWMEKERELKEIEKKHATISLVMEILVKMISAVSSGVMSVEEYSKWVESYEEFFKA